MIRYDSQSQLLCVRRQIFYLFPLVLSYCEWNKCFHHSWILNCSSFREMQVFFNLPIIYLDCSQHFSFIFTTIIGICNYNSRFKFNCSFTTANCNHIHGRLWRQSIVLRSCGPIMLWCVIICTDSAFVLMNSLNPCLMMAKLQIRLPWVRPNAPI